MKKILIALIMLVSLNGFSQIVRTLGNVSNTTDTLKPISNAQRTVNTSNSSSISANTTAISTKAPIASPTFTGTVSGITQTMVGLDQLNNTSDANKPVSTATATALGLKQNSLSGTGFVKISSGTISYDASTYLTSITSANVTTALGFTPYNATNPSGYITSVPAQTFSSLTGKPTTLSGYGIVDAYPLSGNPSSFLTSISSTNVTTALGFTPYNATNPSGFITSTAAASSYLPLASPLFTGDIEASTLNSGVIIKSPNGTRFRITISNTGDIVGTSL